MSGLLWWFGVWFAPVLVFAIAPLVFFASSPGSSRRRKQVSTVLGYLIVAAFLGFFAYEFVPAQYTRGQAWTWPPTSNPLGEIHAGFLQDAENPEVFAPQDASRIRQTVRKEQMEYFRSWLLLALGGLAILVPVVLRFGRAGGRPCRKGNRPG